MHLCLVQTLRRFYVEKRLFTGCPGVAEFSLQVRHYKSSGNRAKRSSRDRRCAVTTDIIQLHRKVYRNKTHRMSNDRQNGVPVELLSECFPFTINVKYTSIRRFTFVIDLDCSLTFLFVSDTSDIDAPPPT
jgi:hypothetical protein